MRIAFGQLVYDTSKVEIDDFYKGCMNRVVGNQANGIAAKITELDKRNHDVVFDRTTAKDLVLTVLDRTTKPPTVRATHPMKFTNMRDEFLAAIPGGLTQLFRNFEEAGQAGKK